MEVLSVKNLSFQYEAVPVLKDVNLGVNRGEMILLCGSCGCGKTTLLRLLKEEIRPAGKMTGEITGAYESIRIGYLFQNPESQIVCRTVEEELAFGAENLGMPREQIARSIAEISAYLGMENLLKQETTKLSGGQKQILNLASLLIMKPKILLLDEPVSQLDPVSSCDFLQLLRKIREELNITILVAEHHLEAFLQDVDRVCYLEEGSVKFLGEVQEFLLLLAEENSHFKHSQPPIVKLYKRYFPEQNRETVLPLNIREFVNAAENRKIQIPEVAKRTEIPAKEKQSTDNKKADNVETILQIKSGYFRYEKSGKDILSNVNLSLKKGRIYALIGGNGAGKSTLFSVMSGYRKLYRGNVFTKQRWLYCRRIRCMRFLRSIYRKTFP